jgi:hypothetical protein
MNLFQKAQQGYRTAEKLMMESNEYNLSIGAPSFKKRLATEEENRKAITLRETPAEFVGAYTARMIADITNDGTRTLWWRYNHPEAIKNAITEKAIGKQATQELGPIKKGLLMTAALAPSAALTGAYDITNVSQQFRPKGFAQNYAEEGSEDRRETSQPTMELFERFFLGRSGRPLKYETAKQDIPDLTPQRYGNFMRSYYQDRGLLGVAKFTPENLEGVPEARLLGFPVTIPSVTSAVGGAAAVGTAARAGGPKGRFTRSAIAGLAGSGAGALVGNAMNQAIASANRPKLPTTTEYTLGMQ